MKTKTKINIAFIIAIVLLLIGIVMFVFYYAFYINSECTSDPVSYANNNSEKYWWDYVMPISYSNYGYP